MTQYLAVLLRDSLCAWDSQTHGAGTAVIHQSDHQRGVATKSRPSAELDWDRHTHGKGTAVKRKSDGRRGVVSCGLGAFEASGRLLTQIKFDDDGSESGYIDTREVFVLSGDEVEIKIRFDDDGSESDWIKTSEVGCVRSSEASPSSDAARRASTLSTVGRWS